jgi:hypothetical protein
MMVQVSNHYIITYNEMIVFIICRAIGPGFERVLWMKGFIYP